MIYVPRPYQKIGLAHMLDNPRCGVWAGMGMGKTLISLAMVDLLRLSGDTDPVLVLAPMRVARDTWPDELARWETFEYLKSSAVVGTPDQRKAALATPADIYTTNYDQLPWLLEQFGDAWPFRTVIADEATRLKSLRVSIQTSKRGKEWLQKNGGGSRAKALAGVAFKQVSRFVELTGTPAPNGLQDLWGQLWFLDGGARLGRSFDAFSQRWFRPDRSGYGVLPLPFADEQIQDAVKDICMTLDPRDWFDLKQPIECVVKAVIPPKARKAYKDMERQMYLEIEGIGVEAFNAASKTMKCLQLANGAIYTNEEATEWAEVHDAKIDALQSIVEEAAGMPLLCAYNFKSDLARLKKAFPKGVDLSTKAGMAAFKAGNALVGFGHPASIGHGVDGLQLVSNIVVFFGHWWTSDERQQFIERVGPVRQEQAGMNRPTYVYDICAERTIDEVVLEKHRKKISTQEALLNSCNQYRKSGTAI